MMEVICHLDDLDSAWASIVAVTEAKDKEHGEEKLVEVYSRRHQIRSLF